ncbi:MAG: iron ABC transporter permease [Bacteroidota bacterium]
MARRNYYLFGVLMLMLLGLSWLHLVVSPVNKLTIGDQFSAVFQFDSENFNHLIARELRIPRLVMAIIAGAGLSVAGLLMQNLFNNALAGPNILGISTGSSLFVAFSIMSGIPFFRSDLGIISSALLGAMLFGLIILLFSRFTKSHTSLLLIGIMIGSFSGAFVSILQLMSDAQELKIFTVWALGSLQQVAFEQLPIIIASFLIGIAACFMMIRSLNAMVLGAQSAGVLGINLKTIKVFIILITALLTGLITAFCGPIAFVGLAVPNLMKIVLKTQNNTHLIIGSLLAGGTFMLCCDIIVQLLEPTIHLPINAITSLIGAPFVIFIILKKLT